MEKFSVTYLGIIVIILAKFAEMLNIPIGTPEITTTITTILEFAGALIALYGRWRKGGITFLGVKKVN